MDDFDEYVNGQWKRGTSIPEDKSRWGSFEILNDENLERQREICQTNTGLVGNLFRAFLNEPTTVSSHVTSLLKEVSEIDSMTQYFKTLSKLFTDHGVSALFHICKGNDDKDPDLYVPHIFDTGLGLNDMSDYTERPELHQPYKDFLQNLAKLYDYSDCATASACEDVFLFEQNKAKLHLTRVESRDAEKTYNKLSWDQIRESCGSLLDFFEPTMACGATSLIVPNPKLQQFNELVDVTSLQTLKNHLAVRIMTKFAPLQHKEIVDCNFDFYGRFLNGQEKQDPRWKRAVRFVNGCLGFELGKLYVEKHFTADKQETCNEMIHYLVDSLRETLQEIEWMTEETRQTALKKLSNFKFKVGAPTKYDDINGLWADGLRLGSDLDLDLSKLVSEWSEWDWTHREVAKFYTKVDRELWQMTPQTVNACFDPVQNEILFPAGILQRPFFGMDTMEENFGAIGAVIGHEMTHGFDDQGRKYNENGELSDWWSEGDAKEYTARAERVIKHYQTLESFGKQINGELTLGENIADIGGLKLALRALEKYTSKSKISTEQYQRFFESWARVWRCLVREQFAHRLLVVDPHSPAVARINGALAHIDKFYEVYNITKVSKLYLEPSQRMNIWT